MPPPETTRLELFADYHQIHVVDEEAEEDFGALWTPAATARGLAASPHGIAVGTAVNVNVAVTIAVTAAAPEDDTAAFDHAVEASVRADSGRLVVMGCTDFFPEAARIAVAPGWVRVRASRSNLAAATEAHIDSDQRPETMERLRLQVWPEAPRGVAVLRRWDGG